MYIIIGIMFLGIGAGYLLRKRKLRHLDNIMTAVVWLLLFLLGVEAGADERIVKWIGSLGLEALLITLAAVAGSSFFAWLLWKSDKTAKRGDKEK